MQKVLLKNMIHNFQRHINDSYLEKVNHNHMHDLAKFMFTAETMQKRRGKTMSQNEKNFLKALYEN